MGEKALFNQAMWLPVDEVVRPDLHYSYSSEENRTINLHEYLQDTVTPDFFKYTQRYGMSCV